MAAPYKESFIREIQLSSASASASITLSSFKYHPISGVDYKRPKCYSRIQQSGVHERNLRYLLVDTIHKTPWREVLKNDTSGTFILSEK